MNYPSRTVAMATLSRTVVSVPRPPAPNKTSITSDNLIYCLFLMSGGRGAEATVLLRGHIRLDKNKYSQ